MSVPVSGEQPRHGDIWRRCHTTSQFTVMHVCGHHNPPHVTGYWWTDGEVDPCAHASYPLPRFLAAFEIIDRPTLDGWP